VSGQVAEVFYHEQKVAEIESEFIAFQNEINNKQERVEEWAEHLEALKTAGKLEIETNEICTYICKRLIELNVEITPQWVRASLEPKYKRDYDHTERKQLSNSTSVEVELPNINRIVDNAGLEQAYEQSSKIEEYARNLSRLARDSKAAIEDKASKNHFQLPNKKSDSVRTADGEIQDTEGWLALGEEMEIRQGIRDNYHERPLPPELDKEFAKDIRAHNETLKPFSDLKYSKSFTEWQQVQITNQHSGKHAASVKHGVILPDGTKRNLTREQVGDSAEEILTKSFNTLISNPEFAWLAMWHKQIIEPVVAQRKAELSPILSEKA
jgi:hypothetical protein